ncbi:hypothetical protein C8E01_1362 [Pontibacter virosus]|uniref:Uncharacterized protein n=1 Tax=Pontibacter virosus TaxID=1765052 RepID=A0A2U1AGR7_9BACT|nr:hypothetical protein C8E01_1362 [Pontibacter virosus]
MWRALNKQSWRKVAFPFIKPWIWFDEVWGVSSHNNMELVSFEAKSTNNKSPLCT